MIRSQEIKEKARNYGVPISTIERDYVQNWLLKYIKNQDIILKGGTGIKKVYFENYRFSDDLDFSLAHSMNDKNIFMCLSNAVDIARNEVGIRFKENIKFSKTETGFRGVVYFNIIQNVSGTPLSIKVDITDYDNEIILLPTEKKKIFHSYSDRLNAEIEVYSLEEIFTEKLRALIQRTRARDLYDIGMLYGFIKKDKMLQILDDKFNFKGVFLDIPNFINRREDFSNAWERSLKHQIKELVNFEIFFDKAVKILKNIQNLKLIK